MAKNKLAGAIAPVVEREVNKRVARDREVFGITAVKAITAMSLVVLHDQFGFGPKRLRKFQELVESQAECLTGEYCSLEELQQLADELAKKVNLQETELTS